MIAIVSFCNQLATPQLAVCAVDLDTGERSWLPLPPEFERGAVGMAELDGALLVACQTGGVIRYGPDLRPSALLPTPGARGLHSILVRPDERALYVIAADNDTLFRYTLDDAGRRIVDSRVVYCADPEQRGEDRYHLNSLAEWQGELYVSMFGPAEGATHRDRRNGRVVRVSDGHVVAEGLYHPHSVCAHGDALLVVESLGHAVRRIAGGPAATWPIAGGYPRGLLAGEAGRIWVGVSGLRRQSASRGTANVLTDAAPIDFRTRLVELDLARGETGRSIDLTDLAVEIFELHPKPAAAAFRPSPEGGRVERIEALYEAWRALRERGESLQRSLDRMPLRRIQRAAHRFRRRFGGT